MEYVGVQLLESFGRTGAHELARFVKRPKRGSEKASARRWAAVAARHYTFGGFG